MQWSLQGLTALVGPCQSTPKLTSDAVKGDFSVTVLGAGASVTGSAGTAWRCIGPIPFIDQRSAGRDGMVALRLLLEDCGSLLRCSIANTVTNGSLRRISKCCCK